MKSSELIQKNIDALVVTRALGLFLFNFTQDAIKELRDNSHEFDYVWKELVAVAEKRHKKDGWISTVYHTEFYDAFSSKMSYKTQAMIIEKALEIHGADARESIEFDLEMKMQLENA